MTAIVLLPTLLLAVVGYAIGARSRRRAPHGSAAAVLVAYLATAAALALLPAGAMAYIAATESQTVVAIGLAVAVYLACALAAFVPLYTYDVVARTAQTRRTRTFACVVAFPATLATSAIALYAVVFGLFAVAISACSVYCD